MNLSYLQIDHERTRDRSLFNLTRFLYLGGSQFKSQYFRKKVEEGKLGEPLMIREPLLQKFKEEAESRLARGDSYVSVKNIVGTIRSLYQFIDTHNLIASEDTLQSNFLQWAAWLDRISSSKRNRKMSGNTAHGIASRLSGFIGSTFEIPYGERFIFKTRLTKTVHAKRATGRLAEKQNLEESFLFGRFIYALATGINRDTLCDSKPKVIVPFKHLSRTIDLTFEKNFVSSNLSKCKKYRIINCRIDAELLLFVSQTGMMPGEALKLRRTTYKYKPLGDEYEVREYKNRKGGEVFFFIHKEYRKHFQNYVEFITEFMPEGDCVFSTYQFNSVVSVIDNYRGERINLLCKEYDIPYVSPIVLRKLKGNWFLRRSRDEDLTVEEMQNTKKVFKEHYEQPSQQRAASEITQFWNNLDKEKYGEPKESALPESMCDGIPVQAPTTPDNVAEANCVNSSGCLWCTKHRDIDSMDYVWSLESMKILKTFEAALILTTNEVPADKVIEKITQKIEWFRASSKKREKWVIEAQARIYERFYHPDWASLIGFIEEAI